MRRLVLASVLALASAGAFAQGVPNFDSSVALTTAVVPCLPANSGRRTLLIDAPSGNAGDVLFCFRAYSTPQTSCTPAAGSAGTYGLAKGTFLFFPGGSAPSNGMDCTAVSTGVISISEGRNPAQ